MPEHEQKKIVTNYAGNSIKDKSEPTVEPKKAERPKLEQVTSGEVIKKKTPLGKKLIRAFTGDDIHNVGHYLVVDVLLPAARNTVVDLVTQGVERTVFGEARPRSSSSGGLRTNYQAASSPIRREDPRPPASRSRSSRDFGVVILANREEAEHVLDQLTETADRFRWATVADLYDLVGQSSNYTDRDWGWEKQHLRDASIERVREGYLVDLPRPVHID